MHISPQDSRYYGCGTSDGTFNKVKYFSCPDNNGLFLSLASVAKQPDWLNLEYRPRRDVPALTEGMQKGSNNAPIPAKRSTKEPHQTSASQKRSDVSSNQLPHGTRDIPAITEGVQKDKNITPDVTAQRSSKEPPQASASTSMEANRGIINTNQLPYGTRVFIRTKGGRKVNGTVRWAGELPLAGEDPKMRIPVYGLETVSFVHENVCKSF